jgi:hypothetical protein
LLADDATWTIIGSTPWSGTYRGKQAILKDLLGPLRARLESPMRTRALRMIGEGDCIAVEARGENRTKDGIAYKNEYCWIFEFHNGLVANLTEYADTELFTQVLGAPHRRLDGP